MQAINQVQDYQDNPHDQECQDNPHDQEDLDHISYDWSVHDESADLGQEHQITDHNGNVIMRSKKSGEGGFLSGTNGMSWYLDGSVIDQNLSLITSVI